MTTTKYLIATVSGFFVMFILGYVGHEFILTLFSDGMDLMEPVMKSEPNVFGIAVAYLVLALLMAYMYPKGTEGTSLISNGLKFSILIGLLFELPMNIIFYSTMDGVTISMVVTEGVWHMIEQGIGGITIAYSYGTSALRGS